MEAAKLNTAQMEKAKANSNALSHFLNTCRKKLADIFEPEVVEISAEEDHGKIVSYTYTVLPQKEVA